jgi:hypothetical protein
MQKLRLAFDSAAVRGSWPGGAPLASDLPGTGSKERHGAETTNPGDPGFVIN